MPKRRPALAPRILRWRRTGAWNSRLDSIPIIALCRSPWRQLAATKTAASSEQFGTSGTTSSLAAILGMSTRQQRTEDERRREVAAERAERYGLREDSWLLALEPDELGGTVSTSARSPRVAVGLPRSRRACRVSGRGRWCTDPRTNRIRRCAASKIGRGIGEQGVMISQGVEIALELSMGGSR
jgi:hypothetical protein